MSKRPREEFEENKSTRPTKKAKTGDSESPETKEMKEVKEMKGSQPTKEVKEMKQAKQGNIAAFEQATSFLYHPKEEDTSEFENEFDDDDTKRRMCAYCFGRRNMISLWKGFLEKYKQELLQDLRTKEDVDELRSSFIFTMSELETKYGWKNTDCPRCEKDVQDCVCPYYEADDDIAESVNDAEHYEKLEVYDPNWIANTEPDDRDICDYLHKRWNGPEEICFPNLWERLSNILEGD
jgi:hypothetical protein